jgi:hypothetical protein
MPDRSQLGNLDLVLGQVRLQRVVPAQRRYDVDRLPRPWLPWARRAERSCPRQGRQGEGEPGGFTSSADQEPVGPGRNPLP